jgi:general secretion pathway protein H
MPHIDQDRRATSGFTLIELLVVVLIIGILMGTAVIAIDAGGDQRAFTAYGQRLVQRIEMARDRAIQNNQEWGMVVDAEDYRFVAYDEDQRQWFPQFQSPFRPDKPPRPVVFQLRVLDQFDTELNAGVFAPNDESLGNQADSDSSGADTKRNPDLVFFSSGETMPFDLELLVKDAAPGVFNGLRISTDGFQPLSLERMDEFTEARP